MKNNNYKKNFLLIIVAFSLCSFVLHKHEHNISIKTQRNIRLDAKETQDSEFRNNKVVSLSDSEIKKLVTYLQDNWNSPELYIIDKFQDHDIIFLSEDHGIKHNLLLVQDIIPLLYKIGVYNVGMEFGASEDQERLDSLVTAPEYNEDIAREIMFNYNVGWAIKEYMDIYKAAWSLNKSLPSDAKKFRIVNLSYKFNWESCDPKSFGIKTPETVRRIFYKGGTEEYRAGVVKNLIINNHEKILVLTGGLHAFTRYQQPEYDYYAEGFYHLLDRSFGNLVYKMVPNKVFTILLHYPFESKTKAYSLRPAMGMIDEVMKNFQDKRVGFDLVGTPLGELRDTSFFSIGHPDFKLSDMADGYIYQKAFQDYEGCTFDEKFFKDELWPEILKQYPDQDMNAKPNNIHEYKEKIKKFLDVKNRYNKIK